MSESLTPAALATLASEELDASSPRTALRSWLAARPTEDLLSVGVEWLSDELRRRERNETLTVERDHVTTARVANLLPLAEAERADRAAKIAEREAVRAEQKQAEQAAADQLRSLKTRVDSAIASHARALKSDWAAALLDRAIRLPDGTQATWGTASIAQHEARAEMFAKQALAGVEGAARHRRAIADLKATGAPDLNHVHAKEQAA